MSKSDSDYPNDMCQSVWHLITWYWLLRSAVRGREYVVMGYPLFLNAYKEVKTFQNYSCSDGVGLILVHNGIVHVAKLILLWLNNNSRVNILLLTYTLVFFQSTYCNQLFHSMHRCQPLSVFKISLDATVSYGVGVCTVILLFIAQLPTKDFVQLNKAALQCAVYRSAVVL